MFKWWAILFLAVSVRAVAAPCPECPQTVVLPGGNFEMGAADGEASAKPPHPVTLRPFAIGKTEVTQAQWRAVMEMLPSRFPSCDECPVESVSWDDIQEYLRRLNHSSGLKYRLPSEAEWEYACRAGGKHAYCGSDDPDQVAWHARNSNNRVQPVGKLKANAFGLVDMSGNVVEWVADCWNEHYEGAPRDGSAWLSGECRRRVVRGGSWSDRARNMRATTRFWYLSNVGFSYSGFRVALDVNQAQSSAGADARR
jgi:formylglycine-generating enzyme required for sulfatase activity